MKTIVRLCPFAFLLILAGITASLWIAFRGGYVFVPDRADFLFTIYLPVVVFLTVISILTVKKRSLSAAVLPVVAAAFSLATLLRVDAQQNILLLTSATTVLCSLIMAAGIGTKGMLRRLSVFITILIAAAVIFAPKFLEDKPFLKSFKRESVSSTMLSPDGKTEAFISEENNNTHKVKIIKHSKDMYFFVGRFKKVSAETLYTQQGGISPSVRWLDDSTLAIDGKEYSVG